MGAIFNNTWYHEIIHHYAPYGADDDTPGAKAVKCLAVANLAAASIIAQAIDGLAATIESKELNRRDSFASAALQGLLPNPESDKVGFDTIAAMASDAAGALIKHLDGEKHAEDE
jgi:hypothetical protein